MSPLAVSQADSTTRLASRRSSKEISLAVNIPSCTPSGRFLLLPCRAILAPANNNPPQQQNPLDKIYTSENSHTNSKNGIRYLLYDQSDSKWGNTKYPDGSTIKDIGCMITAVAVVASSKDNNPSLLALFDKLEN